MKIALYDPEPSACGLMAWTRHLQAGFRALGHDADVVSLTWSGRPRIAWGSPRPGTAWYNRPLDAIGSYRGAREFFSGYDGIILSTPEIMIQDKEAVKNGWSLPKYARALELSEKPFTVALQGFDYGEKWSPFAAATVQLPNFTGTGVAHSPVSQVLNGNEALEKVTWIEKGLPYLPVTEVSDAIPRPRVAGVTGRFCHIKGYHMAALIAGMGMLPDDTVLRLSGASAVSARENITHEIYRFLTEDYGFRGRRGSASIYDATPWAAENGKVAVIYTGAYTEPIEVCREVTVSLCLTAAKNCSGTMDYAQLESIDAGCMMVSSKPQWKDVFTGHAIDPLPTMPSIRRARKEPAIREWLSGAVAPAIQEMLALDEASRRQIASGNREVLREYHRPSAVASAFMEALHG